MPGDAERDEPQQRKRPERRKKRKQKKKKPGAPSTVPPQQLHTDPAANGVLANGTSAPTTEPSPLINPDCADSPDQTRQLESPAALGPTPLMSPRKQALMRHKSSCESIGEPSFVSEAKKFKQNRKAPVYDPPDEGKYPLMLARQNMDGKASLFLCLLAQIVVYQEQMLRASPGGGSGTLLAHGEFEIFQLHNGDVTYLACGRSFVYPLLPRLKMLRTSQQDFILPLVNPERYWKIQVDCSAAMLTQLEEVLKSVVSYTNMTVLELHAGHASRDDISVEPIDQEILGKGDQSQKLANGQTLQDPPQSPLKGQASSFHQYQNQDAYHTPTDTRFNGFSSPPRDNFALFFNAIPESPPSASASPSADKIGPALRHEDVPIPTPLHVLTSDPSHSAAVGLSKLVVGSPNVLHPYPVAYTNPFLRQTAPKPEPLESSSMDLLLNEYEDNIQMAVKDLSRPQSRATSYVSTRIHRAPQTHRAPQVHHTHQNDQPRQNGHHHTMHHDQIPQVAGSTNLPQAQHQNHTVQHSLHASHQHRHDQFGHPSPSQLHPTGSVPRLAGLENGALPDDFPTASLTQYVKTRQASISGRSRKSSVSELYNSVSNWMEPGRPQAHPARLTHLISAQLLASRTSTNSNLKDTYREIYRQITQKNLAQMLETGHESGKDKKPDGLSSQEVYRLLSERDPHHQSSGLRKLFGWGK